MDEITETRILVPARFLAEIHMGDNDELGEMANSLMELIDEARPDIQAKTGHGEVSNVGPLIAEKFSQMIDAAFHPDPYGTVDTEVEVANDDIILHVFHDLWGSTKDNENYDKNKWIHLQGLLNSRGIMV